MMKPKPTDILRSLMGKEDESDYRTAIRIAAPSIVVVLIGFAVAYRFVEPAPPRAFAIASGSETGAYYRFAKLYETDIGEEGIVLNVLPTAGSMENLDMLRAGEVSVAFLQGGIATGEDAEILVAVADVFLEPLWIFLKAGAGVEFLGDLSGKRIAIGAVGSGTREIALPLLADNGIDAATATLEEIGGRAALEALEAGRLDAAIYVLSPTAPLIEEALRIPGVSLMDFSRRHLAYEGRYPYLASTIIPEGFFDLRQNIPDRPATLLAPKAMLVARKDVHPALISLLLQTASAVQPTVSGLGKPNVFGLPAGAGLPVSSEAKRFFTEGPSLLQRYLPFWAAVLIDRLKIMMLPLVTLLLPLVRMGPPVYVWRARVKIYRWYTVLRAIDQRHKKGVASKNLAVDIKRLITLENELTRVKVPLSYMAELYDLNLHLMHVLHKLEAGEATGEE